MKIGVSQFNEFVSILHSYKLYINIQNIIDALLNCSINKKRRKYFVHTNFKRIITFINPFSIIDF